MRILVLSFYFEPDLCAGSFRASSLVNELLRLMPAKFGVDVVTTLPNRYKSFSVDAPQTEQRANLNVHRIRLPQHQSGMFDQSKAFLAFSKEALQYTKSRHYDLVIATSSRLMTASLGAWIARRKKAPLYLDIRDIFVDTIADVLSRRTAAIVTPFFAALESWTIRQASKVNLVSLGFSDYFRTRYPRTELEFFTNGIDEEFIAATQAGTSSEVSGPASALVVYAGNIGEGQGLHKILPFLAKRMEGRVRFRIFGDGGRLTALADALAREDVKNVELCPPIGRDQLIKEYQSADVLFLHLNDYPAFTKVLPSKLFEYAAMGKPIWAGVSGYSREFINSELKNAVVFQPCDVNDAEQVFSMLAVGPSPRADFIKKYSRKNIMRRMARDILEVCDVGEVKA